MATAKYKEKQVVTIKATGERGLIVKVAPLKGGQIAYTIASESGVSVCMADDLEAGGAKSVKQTTVKNMALDRVSFYVIQRLQAARSHLGDDTLEGRGQALRQLMLVNDALMQIIQHGSRRERYLSKGAQFALSPLVDGEPAVVCNPARTPINNWIKAINDAHQQTARIQIVRGIRSAPVPDEAAVLKAYTARQKSLPAPQEAEEAGEAPPAYIGAQASVKALVGAVDHYRDMRKERLLEPIYEAAELVRAHVVVSGDSDAMKSLIALEETLYEATPNPAEWGESVKALIEDVRGRLPQDEEAQGEQETESVRSAAVTVEPAGEDTPEAVPTVAGRVADDVAEQEKETVTQ